MDQLDEGIAVLMVSIYQEKLFSFWREVLLEMWRKFQLIGDEIANKS